MFETLLKLELCLYVSHKRTTETLFRRERACAFCRKRTFETLFKIGALLEHSPQAIDWDTLQMGTGLCSFSKAHSLLKEPSQFLVRRNTNAPTAQHLSSVPRGKQPLLKERAWFLGQRPTPAPTAQHSRVYLEGNRSQSLLEERARFLGRLPTSAPTAQHSRLYLDGNRSQPLLKEPFRAPANFRMTYPNLLRLSRAPAAFRRTYPNLLQLFSCTCRLQNVLQLAFDWCCRAPPAFRTYSGWISAKCSESALLSAGALFKRQQTCASCHKRMAETPFRRSVCLKHFSKLELCLCILLLRVIETLSRRDGLRVHHKRMLEALSKTGALLVHAPQAQD